MPENYFLNSKIDAFFQKWYGPHLTCSSHPYEVLFNTFLYDSAKVHSLLYIFIVMCKEEFLREIYAKAPSKLWLKKHLVVDKLLQ